MDSDRQNPNLRNYTLYDATADYALTKPSHLVVEVDGNQHLDRTRVDQRLGLVGFIYALNNNVSLDATDKIGLTSSSPAWGVGIGTAIEL